MCFVCQMGGLADPRKVRLDDPVVHLASAASIGDHETLGATAGDRWSFAARVRPEDGGHQRGGDHEPAPAYGAGETVFNAGDVAGDASTTWTVAVGGTAVGGAVEYSGDRDWFRVNLVAGQTYTFNTGAGSTGRMDTILTLRGPGGNQLAVNDDISSSNLLSTITYTAGASGTYFLDVSGYGTDTGTYTVRAIASAPPATDAVPGNSATAVAISIGGSLAGVIDVAGDQDWYRVELTAGQTYRFFTSDSSIGSTLTNADLVLRDAGGTQIDIDTTDTYASILYTAPASGTYFLDVRGAGPASGGFTLSAVAAAPLAVASHDLIARHLTHDFWGGAPVRWNVVPGDTLTVDLTALTNEGQLLAREALALWTDVTGIRFSEVLGGGQIVFDDDQSGAFASHSFSAGRAVSGAVVNVGTSWLTNYGAGLNSYAFQAYVHEIGHVLGLGHGGDYNGAADWDNDARFLNDAWVTTVMSYYAVAENTYFLSQNFTHQFFLTPMAADAIATASLYGAAVSTRTGDTIYGFNNNSGRVIYDAAQFPSVGYSIHDHGGIDTLDYSGFSAAQRIDLRPEMFSDVGGRRGNVVIARGATIENAIGGSGNDVLIGNGADNRLGGGGGDDELDGGAGFDTAVFSGPRAAYTLLTLSDGRLQVSGADGTDRLAGFERLLFADGALDLPAGLFEQTVRLVSSQFGAASEAGGWTDASLYPRILADLNGDKHVDIVAFREEGTFVAVGRIDGTFGQMVQIGEQFGAGPAAGGWTSMERYPRLLGDVNGDGRADLVGCGVAGIHVALGAAGGGFGALQLVSGAFGETSEAGGWISQNLYQRALADVNGDGRDDLVGFGEAGTYVALANGGGGFAEMRLATAEFGRAAGAGGWESHDLYPRALGDVNGDGRADIIGFGEDGTMVAFGNADGSFGAMFGASSEFGRSADAGSWADASRYPRLAADINGDGRVDIVGFGVTATYFALSTGQGFGPVQIAHNGFAESAASGGWTSYASYPRLLGDVTGDGRADIVGFGIDGIYISRANAAASAPANAQWDMGFDSAADAQSSVIAAAGKFGQAEPAAFMQADLDLLGHELMYGPVRHSVPVLEDYWHIA